MIDSCDPADGRVMLVGHSGGAIAHAAVDARPERVARVVYVDSVPLALPTNHWAQFIRPGQLGEAILASVGPA